MNAGGLVEMHAHILPGMDDGSKSVEMSIEMLHRLAEMGVAEVCATSHYYAGQNSVTMYLERRAMALEQLREAVGAQDDLPCILPAAEVAYFRGVEEHHPERLCIENTRTLMLEMPFSEWTDQQTEAVTVLALDLHFNVVLVHPERFCFSSNNRRQAERAGLPPHCFAGQRGHAAALAVPEAGAGASGADLDSPAGKRLPQYDEPPAESERRKRDGTAQAGRKIP